MTLQQLYYFQKIAELQHYNKAAKELHVAQPSLSKSMALLEDELKIPLFEKQGRNIILTKYGKVFQGYVDTILGDIDMAKKEMNSMLNINSGHINISYVSPFGHNYIPKLVRKYLNEKGGTKVTFSFKEGFTESMIKSIYENEVDVVFGSYAEDPRLEFFPIFSENLILIAPNTPEYQNLTSGTHSLTEFTEQPFITYDKESSMGKHTRGLFDELHFHPNIICESSDEIAILALVSNEFGISYVAETKEVKKAIAEGSVLQINLKEENSRFLYMIYDISKFQTPAILEFVSFVKNNYKIIQKEV